MHEMESCATCVHYRRSADDPRRGTCERGRSPGILRNYWVRSTVHATDAERWCAAYRNYITGRKDACPK